MAYLLKDEKGEAVKHDGNEVFAADLMGSVKGVNKDDRTLVIIGSDESKDRDGDVITVAGWDLGNFMKNPVFLFAHDHSGVPIGSATKVIRRKNPARLEFHEKFPSEGVYPFADMILNLFQEKVLNATSVGFIPLKWEELPKEEDDLNRWFPGRKFVKQELLELSAVAVPSNPNALQMNSLAKSIASKSLDEIKEMMSPKDRDIILEQLAVKSIEFVDEDRPVMVQVPEKIVMEETAEKSESSTEEFVTVKGEFENKEKAVEKTTEENTEEVDMDIKELFEQIMEKLEVMEEDYTALSSDVTEIKSFITNLTKSDESDTSEIEDVDDPESKDETGDLYKETLSQVDNEGDQPEVEKEGLSSEDDEILKQVVENLKQTLLKE
jgi:hypothetical protein